MAVFSPCLRQVRQPLRVSPAVPCCTTAGLRPIRSDRNALVPPSGRAAPCGSDRRGDRRLLDAALAPARLRARNRTSERISRCFRHCSYSPASTRFINCASGTRARRRPRRRWPHGRRRKSAHASSSGSWRLVTRWRDRSITIPSATPIHQHLLESGGHRSRVGAAARRRGMGGAGRRHARRRRGRRAGRPRGTAARRRTPHVRRRSHRRLSADRRRDGDGCARRQAGQRAAGAGTAARARSRGGAARRVAEERAALQGSAREQLARRAHGLHDAGARDGGRSTPSCGARAAARCPCR